jgi:H+/Cl- antiporter ClcA
LDLVTLHAKDIWIPLAVGIVMGLFAVLFLRYYTVVSALWKKKLKSVPLAWKIFSVFALTVLFGLVSYSFISTGHELILHLFEARQTLLMLLLILVVRSTLTLFANTNGITGGIFLPLLTLGAVAASVMGQIFSHLFGLGEPYYVLIMVLGITGCIAGMMKMPLTAIVFAVEALSCYDNILYVIIVAVTAFIITEIFGAHSINDTVLEDRAHAQNEGKEFRVIDTFVTVQPGAFAVGKQIRDIFWPRNLFVLSVQHGKKHGAEVDEHGGKEIREGDILHVRYSTYEEEKTAEELMDIVGEQVFDRSVDAIV